MPLKPPEAAQCFGDFVEILNPLWTFKTPSPHMGEQPIAVRCNRHKFSSGGYTADADLSCKALIVFILSARDERKDN
jgi:hypothetical protein